MDYTFVSNEDLNVYQDLNVCKNVQKIAFMKQALFNLRSFKTMVRRSQQKQEMLKKYIKWIQLIVQLLYFVCIMDFKTYGPIVKISDRQLSYQFEKIYGFNNGQKSFNSVWKFEEFLKNLLQNTIQINQNFLVQVDIEKINFQVQVHWKKEESIQIQIDINKLQNEAQIDYEKNNFGLPLMNEDELKRFMKEIWCIEINIKNIIMPIAIPNKIHNVVIQHKFLVYEEDNKYVVTIEQEFQHVQEFSDFLINEPLSQESFQIHIHEIFLLLLIFLSLFFGQSLVYWEIQKKTILKYFEVDLIMYKKELQNQIKLKQIKNLKKNFFPWIQLMRDLVYILFFITKLLMIESKTTSLGILKNLGFILSLILLLPQLMQHERLKIFFQVIKVSLRNMINLVKHLSAITMAFILIGNFLFQNYFHFSTLQKTAATVFSMMVGDSVLDFFNETQEDSMTSFLYLVLVTFYLILFWHNLYITLVTNHYFEIVDELDKDPQELNAEDDSFESKSEFDEEELIQNQAELVQNLYMKISLKLKTLRASEQNAMDKLKKIHEVQEDNNTQNLELFKNYIQFLKKQIQSHIEQVRNYRDNIK